MQELYNNKMILSLLISAKEFVSDVSFTGSQKLLPSNPTYIFIIKIHLIWARTKFLKNSHGIPICLCSDTKKTTYFLTASNILL
jgi:hypothetical protein